jgi:hypothetical protein
MATLATDLLIVLVALARQQYHVGVTGRDHGVRDGGARRPARICARIASGSSLRGLSLVSTTRSASRSATAAISGRLSGSRSPPQPTTTANAPPRALASGRNACNTFSSASGVCA